VLSFYFKRFIAASFLGLVCILGNAQTGLCPSNLNFELGDFTGWECRYGSALDPLPFPNLGIQPGRHTIIDSTIPSVDPFGSFPQSCPNGSRYSVKLGNQTPGAQAESISYTYTIPSALSVFSMIFHYAVVLESPGHIPSNQPRFQARIIDVATGLPIACVDFDFIPQTTPGGFRTSPILGNGGSQVLYKDWTPISINLNAYIGQTIKLEFVTRDCTQTGHAGYAYVDVNTSCNGVIAGNFICPGDTSLTLTAPFGFQNYEWYSDNTFSTIISTTQTLYLNPLPSVGTIYPIVVTPFPGFGCKDTLYARIDVGIPPAADAGPDKISCQLQPVQIGAPPNPTYTYEWTPVAQVSNPNISDPFAFTTISPTSFIVKATDILNGCTAYDTTIVSPYQVDTTLTVNGKTDYCPDEPSKAQLSVSNSVGSVQWYDASGPIPGAVGITYQPTASGLYWAQVIESGCVDSTRSVGVQVNPFPFADFSPDSDTGCVTRNSFLFRNASTVSDGSALSYVWSFPDGTTQTITDAVKTFPTVGRKTIKLLVTSAPGCKDSTSRDVIIMPNGVPNFLWDSVCTNRPTVFYNLSVENNSPQVNYIWDFKNGGPFSTLKVPLPVSYSIPGLTDVSLKLIALGCENDTQTVVHSVLVNRAAPGIRYPDVVVPLGSSKFIHVRDSIGQTYNWKPAAQLTSPWSQYTEFYATYDDIKYLIDITDQHTCVTTDTMQLLILRKPGYYLPTAFTPNDDGLNDVARPYLIGMKALKSFSIFDRWGNQVFYTTREGEGWDGKFKGEKANAGVYVWVLVFKNADDKEVSEKGTITIIR
jgi:gliding motility-associated-like protein